MARYPQDFAGAVVKGPSFPLGRAGMAGRPNRADPILVCRDCGHNQDP